MDPKLVPKVQLPVKADMYVCCVKGAWSTSGHNFLYTQHAHRIKHPNELPGKSTATHARILAPDDVSIHILPDVPDYGSHSRVVLIFPKEVGCFSM